MCNSTASEYHKIINKSLYEIISYIINQLDTMNNDIYKLNQRDINSLSKFFTYDDLEFIQVLSQYVVRQSIGIVLDKLNSDFKTGTNYYYQVSVVNFAIFIVFLCIVQSLAMYVSRRIFKDIKKVNKFLISILPNEYINKLLDEK